MKVSRLLKSRWELLTGLFIVALFVGIAVAAPYLSPAEEIYDEWGTRYPASVRLVGREIDTRPKPPGPDIPLGTTRGRLDVFHSLVWGARDALRFGLTVGLIAALIGVLVGTASGYYGGWIDWLMMRITDGFLTFPLIAAVVLFNELKGFLFAQLNDGLNERTAILWGVPINHIPVLTENFLSFESAMILFSWMVYARLLNAIVAQIKTSEFVEAARALGASNSRIIFRHLIPNSISPAIVLLSRDIGGIVLIQSALTFIQIGGESVWGNLLVAGRDWIIGAGGNPFQYWWVFVPGSLAIILFGVGWSLLGDGLNDMLNPRQQRV